MAVEEEKGQQSDLCLKYCSLLLLLSPPTTFIPQLSRSCAFRLFLSSLRDSRNELERLINSPFDQTWEESIAGDDKPVYCFTVRVGELAKRRIDWGNREKEAKDSWRLSER